MSALSTHLMLLSLAVLVAVLLALLTAVAAALVARWDNCSWPASLQRAASAFVRTLTVLIAVLAVLVDLLT